MYEYLFNGTHNIYVYDFGRRIDGTANGPSSVSQIYCDASSLPNGAVIFVEDIPCYCELAIAVALQRQIQVSVIPICQASR